MIEGFGLFVGNLFGSRFKLFAAALIDCSGLESKGSQGSFLSLQGLSIELFEVL